MLARQIQPSDRGLVRGRIAAEVDVPGDHRLLGQGQAGGDENDEEATEEETDRTPHEPLPMAVWHER